MDFEAEQLRERCFLWSRRDTRKATGLLRHTQVVVPAVPVVSVPGVAKIG